MTFLPSPACAPRQVRRARRALVAGGALLTLSLSAAPALAAGVVPSPPTSPPTAAVPLPRPPAVPAGLPTSIEGLAPYVPADSCDPVAKPGTEALARLLQTAYPGTGSSGISNTCAAEGGISEHTEGRAFDWTVNVNNPAQVQQVQSLFAWLFATDAAGNPQAMARRLGIMYIIWDAKIWGSYRPADGWRPYACSGATACHRDHVHLSLSWAGAQGRTSFWTSRVAADDYGPCTLPGRTFALRTPAPNPSPCRPSSLAAGDPLVAALAAAAGTTASLPVGPAGSGPAVSALQSALGGLTVDGNFGSATRDELLSFQSRRGLARTGLVDRGTWAALVSAVSGGKAQLPPAVLPGTPAAPPTPSATPVTPAPSGVPVPAPRPAPVTAAPVARPLPSLQLGSRGPLVVALQRWLRIPADGVFGRGTQAALRRFQVQHHQPVTGVAGTRILAALQPARPAVRVAAR